MTIEFPMANRWHSAPPRGSETATLPEIVAAPRKLLSPFGGPSMIRLVREFLSKAPTLRLPFTS